MKAAISDYLENALINALLRGTNYISSSAVALFTSSRTDAGTRTEVNGGAYARKVITFCAPSDGVAVSSADVLFPVATASWGTITHIGIYDALTGGNLLFLGVLTNSKTIVDDQFKIAAGVVI